MPATLPEEQQFLFLLELIPPTVEREEDGCVASAFHRAVCFSVGVLDLIRTVVAQRREKTKALKELSDTTECACWMVAE